jgi:uncharacterized protein (TIGR03905 family)
MDKHFVFKTAKEVCADEISFDYVDGYIFNVDIVGGCDGNSHAVMSLVEGMKAEDVIKRTQNITCHGGNSCPKELAKAVRQCIEEAQKQVESETNK